MRNPLEVDSRGFRLRSVVHGDEGGSARRFSPASGVLSSRAGYDLGNGCKGKGRSRRCSLRARIEGRAGAEGSSA